MKRLERKRNIRVLKTRKETQVLALLQSAVELMTGTRGCAYGLPLATFLRRCRG